MHIFPTSFLKALKSTVPLVPVEVVRLFPPRAASVMIILQSLVKSKMLNLRVPSFPVGQDCYTRIWSLQDAQLLRTIPSPHSISKDAIPSVVLSSRLGGSQGVPGLLMAVKQDLYHFSYN